MADARGEVSGRGAPVFAWRSVAQSLSARALRVALHAWLDPVRVLPVPGQRPSRALGLLVAEREERDAGHDEGNWTRVDRKMLWSPAASSSQQRARGLTSVKALRFASPPLRGADGLDAGSAHARPDWLLLTMPTHTPPTCCGRRPVQDDTLSSDR